MTSLMILLPLLFGAAFGLSVPGLSRRLPPAFATWLLSVGALLLAVASCASLAVIAFGMLARTPALAAQGRWSGAVLARHHLGNVPAGTLACAAVAILGARFIAEATTTVRAVRDAHRLAAGLGGAGAELVVLDAEDRHAVAVPGRPGRIAVTTGLLRVLDAGQRRAVLAHERSHLAHRHHLHVAVVRLAAAVNPLLSRLPAAAALAVERWADEDAATAVPRDTVATALTRTATDSGRVVSPVVLAVGAVDVAHRLSALDDPPRLTPTRVVVPVGLLVAAAVAVGVALHDTERIFELAQVAYSAGRR